MFIDHPTPEASWRAQQGPRLDPGAAACLPFPRQPRKAGLHTLSLTHCSLRWKHECVGFLCSPSLARPPLCGPGSDSALLRGESATPRADCADAAFGQPWPEPPRRLLAGRSRQAPRREAWPASCGPGCAGPAPEPRLPKFLLTQRGPRPRSQFPRNPRPSTLPALCRVCQELSVPPSSPQAPSAPPGNGPLPSGQGWLRLDSPKKQNC